MDNDQAYEVTVTLTKAGKSALREVLCDDDIKRHSFYRWVENTEYQIACSIQDQKSCIIYRGDTGKFDGANPLWVKVDIFYISDETWSNVIPSKLT